MCVVALRISPAALTVDLQKRVRAGENRYVMCVIDEIHTNSNKSKVASHPKIETSYISYYGDRNLCQCKRALLAQ